MGDRTEAETDTRWAARYVPAMLDALRASGGAARLADLYAWIAANCSISEEERWAKTAVGQNRFENRVRWARFYLAHAGLVDKSTWGLSRLTKDGERTELTGEDAIKLVRKVSSALRASREDRNTVVEQDERAPPEAEEVEAPSDTCWFVGAYWGEDGDQTQRFLRQGVWENGYEDRYLDEVRSMRPGERIAIKASYRRAAGLPFDNGGQAVSVMAIKAVGTITGNPGDGRQVTVAWRHEPSREWYFYTNRKTVWRQTPDKPDSTALIRFAFEGEEQDFQAFQGKPSRQKQSDDTASAEADDEADLPSGKTPPLVDPPYDVDSIVADGCFLPRGEVEKALALLRRKKNLILQGPPGTGKTWLAKRLGYALLGAKAPSRLIAVQFQPSLSYEDFVRGWRPDGRGSLALIDGLFLEVIAQARALPPGQPFVLVIEEINRGNPAQIFGELLTLLETDKRRASEGLRLAYPRAPDESVYVPDNLYIIGTMNLADRSLALVDLALRRRFSFLTLRPALTPIWKEWCIARGAPEALIDQIADRLSALNDAIATERSLGPQFRVGHSFVTPSDELKGASESDWIAWFAEVVEAEIGPLLAEYWYDDAPRGERETEKLLGGL